MKYKRSQSWCPQTGCIIEHSTVCPYIYRDVFVGSHACSTCDNFVGIDKDNKIVYCNYEEPRQAPPIGPLRRF